MKSSTRNRVHSVPHHGPRAVAIGSVAWLLLAAGAHGQVREWVQPVSGLWSVPSNWNPPDVPDTASEDALIEVGGVYSVFMDQSVGIRQLLLLNPDATLEIAGGRSFSTRNTGGSTVNGIVLINSAALAGGTVWTLDRPPVPPGYFPLNGTGYIYLNSNVDNPATARLATASNVAAAVGPGLTIAGSGQVIGNYRLEGAIVANNVFGGPLQVLNCNVAGFNGTGRLGAEGGAVLSVVANGAHRTISDVQMGAQTGGSFEFDSDSFWEVKLQRVELTGPVLVRSGASLQVEDSSFSGDTTMENNSVMTVISPDFEMQGDLLVNESNGPNSTRVVFNRAGALLGAGTITLNANAGNLETAVLDAGANGRVTLGPERTVRGAGRMRGAYLLGGTIRADDSLLKRPLQLLNADVTNPSGNGRIEADGSVFSVAANGDTTSISDVPMTARKGGRFEFDSDSFWETTLARVVLTGPSRVRSGASLRLNSCSFTGDMTIENNSVVAVTSPNFELNGNVTVNESNGPNSSRLEFNQVGTLGGGGVITLNANANNLDTAILDTRSNGEVSMGPAWTVRGGGRLYGRYVLGGVIRADDSVLMRPLQLMNATVTNMGGTGRIESDGSVLSVAANGNTTLISGVPMTASNGGGFEFDSDSFWETTLRDTTLTGPSRVRSGASLVLDDCSFTGDMVIENNSVVTVSSPVFTLQGDMLVNESNGQNASRFVFSRVGVLSGAGVIMLNASLSNFDTAYLDARPHGGVTTIEQGFHLRGQGRLYGAFEVLGEVSPGTASPLTRVGRIDVPGSLTLTGSSTLAIDVESATSFDRLSGAGGRQLDGARLLIELRDGYAPSGSTSFDILPSGGPVTGTFGSVVPPQGYTVSIAYATNSVSVTLTRCPGDYDGNGVVNSQDFFAFLTDFFAGRGDFNGDGQTTSQDFFDFITAFFATCE